MEQTVNELLGSQVGAAKTDCGSGIVKRIRKTLMKICRRERNLQIVEKPERPVSFHLTINLNNVIKDIEHLHLGHADVAVGVAEAGSNVYHHKTNDNGR